MSQAGQQVQTAIGKFQSKVVKKRGSSTSSKDYEKLLQDQDSDNEDRENQRGGLMGDQDVIDEVSEFESVDISELSRQNDE